MRIVNDHVAWFDWHPLRRFGHGTVIRFRVVFNQKYTVHDIFIVNAVCNTYMPFHGRDAANKVAVTCLRTGDLAYAKSDREARQIEASVHIDEKEN